MPVNHMPQAEPPPFVIIGAGPVGIRMMQELSRLRPGYPIHIYSAENRAPYNRVQLAEIITKQKTWQDISQLPDLPNVQFFPGNPIRRIFPKARIIVDSRGNHQRYHTLIIATGSSPYLPPLEGRELEGVYVLHTLDDAVKLANLNKTGLRVVVVGGGLLGVESAYALNKTGADVTLVEMSPHLMPRQLDQTAAGILEQHILALGIKLTLNDPPDRFVGEQTLRGLQLKSGQIIPCDIAILSTGVRPNIQLAQQAELAVGLGIKVNPAMRTSDPHIFAIGECIEYQGKTIGLLGPGLEQAKIAAQSIAGIDVNYQSKLPASRLKLASHPSFSMGNINEKQDVSALRSYVFHQGNTYRKLVLRQNVVVGALSTDHWQCATRLQEHISQGLPLRPWQLWLFQRNGLLWDQESQQHVNNWPANALVCNCTGINRGQLSLAIKNGCSSVAQLTACTGAGGVCGSCKPLLADLVGNDHKQQAIANSKRIYLLALLALLLGSLLLFIPALPYSHSIELNWDKIWRDNLFKQISGYSLLTLTIFAATLSLRKRLKRFTLGHYDSWRLSHIVLGVVALFGLLIHTGGHMGFGLSGILTVFFVGAALAGSLLTLLIAREHEIPPSITRRIKPILSWGHLLLLWPLPVLLGFHIAQGYIY